MGNPYDKFLPDTQPDPGPVEPQSDLEPIESITEPVEAPGVSIMGKGLFQSKTFWVNLLMSVVSLAVFVQDSALVADNPQIVAGIGAAVGFVNIVLRLLTKEPIKLMK
jgi:hypothetical protein